MRKLSALLILLLVFMMTLTMIACDEETPTPPTNGEQTPGNDTPDLQNITGVTLTDATHTYDGTEKMLTASGTLPEGVTVAYTNHKAVDAGTYAVTATLSGAGYNTLTLNATLTINKAQITGVTVEADQTVDGDGEQHLPAYNGTLPTGVTVQYLLDTTETPNGVSAFGTYNFKLIFSGANYEPLEFPVTYKVKINAANLAADVVNAFGAAPDPWAFLPESFAPAYHTVTETPNYDSFLNVSDIPLNGIGKQMNAAYGLLNKTTVALSYVNKVMGVTSNIKDLYSAYIDSNPADYQNFSGSISGFTFAIALDEDRYFLHASVGSVLVELFADASQNIYGATVKLTATTVLKYTVTDDALLIAMDILDTVTTQIEFARDENGNTVGVLYEYLTVAGKQVTGTSAMIEVGEDYTVVIGTKGDFIPTSVSRNCEIYDNATGCLIGSEVREDVEGTVFNTYWFPLYHLDGIDSIMKVDEMNGTNADTIYINGIDDDTLHTKLMGISFGGKLASRRYDVEFKTVYGYIYNSETGEYEEVKY
ncbi:MAG: hypothetical protein IJY22_06105 [Clostridia bacterium]|nr:hypothetical protein [Clostridia bacterium]